MVCSLYTPGIEYVEPDLLSGVTLETLAAAKWGAKVNVYLVSVCIIVTFPPPSLLPFSLLPTGLPVV